MKKIILITLILFTTMFSATNLQAQDGRLVMTEEEKTEFKERIRTMLDNFLYNLSRIGSKSFTASEKEAIIRSTLHLFLNDGEDSYDEYNNLIPAPRMQVTSLKNPKGNRLPIKQYLRNLLKIPYQKVTISQAKAFHLGDLKKVGDHYEAVATYFQCFRGETGEYKYEDITKKNVRIIVQVEEVLGERTIVVRFGDIDAMSTEAITN